MVDPGFYVIEELNYGYNPHYYSTADGYLPDTKKVIYGGFSVKPREIVYLGDITVDATNVKMPISVGDSYEQAEQFFYKKYSNFSTIGITKRFFSVNKNPFPVKLFGEIWERYAPMYTPIYLP